MSKSDSIQRINLVPMRRLEMSKSILLQNILKPYFRSNIGNCLHKGQQLDIQDNEFYVKYNRPFFGSVQNCTEVKMDSSVPKSVRMLRIAPIWDTSEELKKAQRSNNDILSLVKNQILKPYFFGGLMIYLEKGETLIIAGREFFVNECQPRSGIVDASTILQVEIGFT